jgi:hypothetical protein
VPGAVHFFENALDAGGPDEGSGPGVPGIEEIEDGALQLGHAAKGAAAHRLLFEFGEPAFDQVEPTGTGGNEVEHEAGMTLQPAPHPSVAVGAVVVEDQVQDLVAGKLVVESPQELQELLMTVAGVALANDPALHNMQRGEQRGDAVPLIVVGVGAAAAGLERQTGLCAVEGLDLALFIDAQRHGVLGRSEIDADHVGELLQEARIAGELEAPGQVRLQAVVLPGQLDGVFADALGPGEGTRAPAGRASRLGLQSRLDPLSDPGGVVMRFTPATGSNLPDAANALLPHPPTPQRSGLAADGQRGGDHLVGLTRSRVTNDPRTQHDLLRRRPGTNPLTKTAQLCF